MKIQQIRNATLKNEYGGQTMLLDPWLQDQGAGSSAAAVRPEMNGVRCPLNALPITPDEILAGVDFCLVTHIHPDHFTADYLPKGMKIIVQNENDRQKAESMGFENVLAFEKDTMNLGSVFITKVPAIHGDNEEIVKRMGAGSGYVLSGESRKLYIAGGHGLLQHSRRNAEKVCPGRDRSELLRSDHASWTAHYESIRCGSGLQAGAKGVCDRNASGQRKPCSDHQPRC